MIVGIGVAPILTICGSSRQANVPRLRVAVLNCDSGVPPIVPTALVPAVLRQASLGQLLLGGQRSPSRSLRTPVLCCCVAVVVRCDVPSSSLAGSSIYNATSPASGALRWEAYSCSYLAGQNVSMGCG